jgi:predicted NAD/FAD-dependent oxidoreductase
LAGQGHEVLLFEMGPGPGGRSFSYRAGGFCLDTGAAFITNFYPRFLGLARELGCDGSIRELHRITGLCFEGETARLNVGSAVSFLRFPFLTLGEKLRMAMWTARLTLRRRRYDIADPATLLDVDGQSVEEHALAAVGAGPYHYLVRPGIEPFWYFRCEDVSEGLLVGLTAHAAGARFYYLDGGIDQLCQRMAASADLRLQTEVIGLEAVGERVRVDARTASGETSEVVDAVVLASTASVAGRLVAPLPEGWVSQSQRDFLSSQRYVANVHAAFRIPRLETEPVAGSVFPCGPGHHEIAALSFHRFREPRGEVCPDELVSLYLSDEASREMMSYGDDEVFSRCLALARTLAPEIPEDAAPFHLVRRAEAIPVHAVGRYRLAHEFECEQAARGGPVLFCGDYLGTATLEGAVATGFAAARAVTTTSG